MSDEARLLEAMSRVSIGVPSQEPPLLQSGHVRLHFTPSDFGTYSVFQCELQLLRRNSRLVKGEEEPVRLSCGRLSAESRHNANRGNEFESDVNNFLQNNGLLREAKDWESLVKRAAALKDGETVFVSQCSLDPPPQFRDELMEDWPEEVKTRMDFGRCIPDIIRLEHVKPGEVLVTAIDIKSSQKVKSCHKMQIAYYCGVIKSFVKSGIPCGVTLVLNEKGEVWIPCPRTPDGKTHARCPFSVEQSLPYVKGFFRTTARRLAECQSRLTSPDIEDESWFTSVPWKLANSCTGCQFLNSCRKYAHRTNHPSCCLWSSQHSEESCGQDPEQWEALRQGRWAPRRSPGKKAQRLPHDTTCIFVAIVADLVAGLTDPTSGFFCAVALVSRFPSSSSEPALPGPHRGVFRNLKDFIAVMGQFQGAHWIVWNASQRAVLTRLLKGIVVLDEKSFEGFAPSRAGETGYCPKVLRTHVTVLQFLLRDVICLPVPGAYLLKDLLTMIKDDRFDSISFDVFDSVFAVDEREDDEVPTELLRSEQAETNLICVAQLMERAVRVLSESDCCSLLTEQCPNPTERCRSTDGEGPSHALAVVQLLRKEVQFVMCSELTSVVEERARFPCKVMYSPSPEPPSRLAHFCSRFVVSEGLARKLVPDNEAFWSQDVPVRNCDRCKSVLRPTCCTKEGTIPMHNSAGEVAEVRGDFFVGRWYFYCQCQGSFPTIEDLCRREGKPRDCFGKKMLFDPSRVKNDIDATCCGSMFVPGAILGDIAAIATEGNDLVLYIAIWQLGKFRLRKQRCFSLGSRFVAFTNLKVLKTLDLIESEQRKSIVNACFRSSMRAVAITTDTALPLPTSTPLPASQKECLRGFLSPAASSHECSTSSDAAVIVLQGPPGTGKSHTLALCILTAVLAVRDVPINAIVCAVTHRALAGVANKWTELAKDAVGGPPFLILHFVSSSELNLFPSSARKWYRWPTNRNAPESFAEVLALSCDPFLFPRSRETASCIVLCTAWEAFKRGLKNKKRPFSPAFDIVAFDEASQMTLAEATIPSALMRYDHPSGFRPRFLVAGDFMQLAPILPGDLSTAAPGEIPFLFSVMQAVMLSREGGRFLSASESRNCEWIDLFVLRETFRCVPKIAEFVSRLYPNGLESQVEPFDFDQQSLSRIQASPSLARDVLLAVFGNELVTVTDVPPAEEPSTTCFLASLLFAVDAIKHVLVVTPHRRQREAIKLQLASAPYRIREGRTIDVDTTECVQGSQADATILALALDVEHDPQFIFNLLRLNVAFSRARYRIIVVASTGVLQPPSWIVLQDEAVLQGHRHISEFCSKSAQIPFANLQSLQAH